MNSCNQSRINGKMPCNGPRKPMPDMPCGDTRKPMTDMPCSGARKSMTDMPCGGARKPMTDMSCENGRRPMPDYFNQPVGMTYVPLQKWQDIYKPEDGFHYGTIFKELNLMFTGKRVC